MHRGKYPTSVFLEFVSFGRYNCQSIVDDRLDLKAIHAVLFGIFPFSLTIILIIFLVSPSLSEPVLIILLNLVMKLSCVFTDSEFSLDKSLNFGGNDLTLFGWLPLPSLDCLLSQVLIELYLIFFFNNFVELFASQEEVDEIKLSTKLNLIVLI